MEVITFIDDYKEAFGLNAGLPLAFWYSDHPAGNNEKINGCIFKMLPKVNSGEIISLSVESMTCGGGKFYCGFTSMPERVPKFVSLTEKYKRTPEDVIEFLDYLQVPESEKAYLNFARIDKIISFEDVEGIIFFADPDILSGLFTWACLDNNDPDAVSSPFGSGCSATVTLAVLENRKKGRRCFLGGFDPSVRPYLKENELSFTIPISRFREMYETMHSSCLYDTHAWKKVKERIDNTILKT